MRNIKYLLFVFLLPVLLNGSNISTENENFSEATKYLNNGKLDEAKSLLTTLEDGGYATSNPLLYYSLGRLNRNIYQKDLLKKDKESIDLSVGYFNKFLTAVKGNGNLEKSGVVNLIYALIDDQNYKKIQPLLDEYKDLPWDDDGDLKAAKAHALNAIGFKFYKTRNFQDAREYFSEANLLEPRWPLYAHNLINACEGVIDLNLSKDETVGALVQAKGVYDNFKNKSYWKRDPRFLATGSVIEAYLRIYKNLLK